MRVTRLLSVLLCIWMLLGLPIHDATRQSVDVPIRANFNTSFPPLIQEFFINNTWAGQPSQFSFNVTDNVALDHAIFECNVTQTFTNDSSTPLSGIQAWANYTHTLPSLDCVISFQLWVWNSNSSSCTTGPRYMKIYTYNGSSNAWNTPYISLVDAIQNIDLANNWASVETYPQTILAKKTTTDLANMIDNYASSADWTNVLKWSAFCNKLGIARQNAVMDALNNFAMAGNLPSTASDRTAFVTEYRWALYGYYYAIQYNANLTKWNSTAAFNQFNSSIYQLGKPALWIYANGTAQTLSDRYYDEDASTVDCYIIFAELLNVSDAMNDALHWWNYDDNTHWDNNYQYYTYTPHGGYPGYECEAGFFLKIVSILKYYSPLLQNWSHVLSDIGNRFLSSEWNSAQWLSSSATSVHVVVHKYAGNSQRRLQNTLGAWQALLGVYLSLNNTYENNLIDMLCGNNNTEPAWALLLRPEGNLYDSLTNMFRWESPGSWDYGATAYAEILLFMMGIVPGTTTIAFPLEELNYEYIQDIDCRMLELNLTTRTIALPVTSAGNITFQYGVSPVPCSLSQPGVYQITFSNSWNVITNVKYESALPNNIIYFGEAPSLPYDVTIAAHCVTEGADVDVDIVKDGSPTDYKTPCTFTGLTAGTHMFAVPDNDTNGEPFKHWSTGSNSTTITVGSEGTYTAYYGTSTLHDVAITGIEPSKTVVGQGYSQGITVTAANRGDFTEDFNVIVYANTTSIASQNVTLSVGDSMPITFTCNTSALVKGNYSIDAYASPVLGETDVADNNFTDGWVCVSITGDLTGGTPNLLDFVPDGMVNMKDVGVVARFFRQDTPPAPSDCDITGPILGVPDDTIDMRDVGIVARQFGQHCLQ